MSVPLLKRSDYIILWIIFLWCLWSRFDRHFCIVIVVGIMADPRIRQIKIKTGVVRRVAKEGIVYAREAELQRARVQRLKDADEEEHTVRKQEEVLQEALMMVPDCRRRLQKAHVDLKGILESELDLKENADYIAAQQVLKDAEIQLAQPVEE